METNTRRVDTGIIQRGKTYRFTAYLGYDSNKKQIRKTATFAPPAGLSTKKSDQLAKEEYLRFRNECKGFYSLQEHMRFSELVTDYFTIYANNKLKPITIYNYEKLINYHFMNYFGNKKLKDITPVVINRFFSTHTSMIHGSMQSLSASNAKKLYCILQSVFTFAVAQGYLKETPCHHIILPKTSLQKTIKRKYLTEEELPEFLALFQEYSPLQTIILTLLFTGMRTGECLGLQWSDIDFIHNKIFIRHTLSEVGGTLFLTSPKTDTSIRYLYMNRFLSALLKKHQAEQQMQFLQKKEFSHPEMVFTSANGNYKSRHSLSTSFRKVIKNTNFSFMTLHNLRHTNATLLLNHGIDLKIVSEHLGHADISTTADIYISILDNSRKETADTLEKILLNTK